MKKINFNNDWLFRHLDKNEEWTSISLPHDAMINEPRVLNSEGGTNTGWFVGEDYEYKKTFLVDESYSNKILILEFEAIYHNAEIYLNNEKIMYRPYGYTNFYVSLNKHLKIGEINEIRVIARNKDQPNSRWYSGAGIYRPVYLYVFEKEHIKLNSLKIRTLSISPITLDIKFETTSSGEASFEIFDNDVSIIKENIHSNENGEFHHILNLKEGKTWSVDSPNLYDVEIKFKDDVLKERFGIRTVKVTAKDGFLLNGKRVIIRGACIHHDNGILGARCYKEAEYRKIKILKENGYNAIRSAHNPCSKYLLEACDELGMMVMDEYCDMWYIHKTMYDYASYVMDWYEEDIKDMVDKDFNHPSVIMYSLGNEVAETGQAKGIEFFKTMRDVIKKYDPDKPVTTGVNIFFNYLHSLGFGVYTDKKAKENPQKKVGSEFFNDIAGIFGAKFMKTMAMLPGCDKKTKDCYAAMDVAGYNYGIKRYKRDIKKYPNRIILGSETFCADAYAFYEFAKKYPALIGDFVWAGMDYLGEVGIGSWEYKSYAPTFKHGPGWISAGSGRIDLIGNPLGEALYTKVAFELEDKPQIAVVPVPYTNEKHSPSAWKFSNAISSWSWPGCNGKKAEVEIYSRAPIVELYVNNKKVGRKKFKNNCRFNFTVKYYDGEITAVNLDKNGNILSKNTLKSASDETIIHLSSNKELLSTDEIVFINIRYTDNDFILKPLIRNKIHLEVEGGELLALGHACPFNVDGFDKNYTDTYYGQALAAIKVKDNKVIIKANDGNLSSQLELNVK
jgi:beta-galactosidase